MNTLALPALANIPFVSAENLQPPAGVPTGVSTLDNFLLWRGVPKGELSLFQGSPGTGATSLWVGMTQQAHSQNKWVAWVNGGAQLLPAHLVSRQVNLSKLLVVKEPREAEQLFWILQELITSSLFEVIGCELKEMFFKNHQLQKLKKLCRMHKVALIFVCHKASRFVNPLFSLIIQFQRDFITIQRALHRPTPFSVAGSTINANFISQFKNAARKLLG
ncbi:MAG TPA: recA protein [Bdellovibrio sp.]|uniref:recA protein n=1 Tax=Bdellovibrio sp. TaxID=28201 RepID=UPI002F1882DA